MKCINVFSPFLAFLLPIASFADPPCYQTFIQYHHLVDLNSHASKRLSKSPSAFEACEHFPQDSSNNILFEVVGLTGKIFYSEAIFAQLNIYFDDVKNTVPKPPSKKQKKLAGGVSREDQIIITFSIPSALSKSDPNLKVRFKSIRDGNILAQGSL